VNKTLRVAYIVSHPIQYQAPLLRRLAQEPDISLTVFFGSDFSVKEYKDEGFGGIQVKWDVPLLEGYQYEYLPAIRHSTNVSFWSPLNRGIYRALKKGRFDVVWVHGYWSINCLVTMVAAKLLGVPLLERAEGTLIDHSRSAFKRAIKRVFFSIARHFIGAVLPISSRNRDYWTHYLGSDFPSFMVPYTVANEYFQKMVAIAGNSRDEFRRQLDLEQNRPIILYASKLMSRKRCMDLIDAYISMKPTVDGKKPYLLIVGDGSERPLCEARVRAAGESSVRFLGFQNQSQLAHFYDLCDLFVLPSEYEPFGLIVNEVMNAGKAIIVSDEVGCRPDLVKDGVNGRVFPAGNVEALRTVLKSMLGDPKVMRDMGRRSLERINRWSFEEDIRGLRKALNHLAGLPLTPNPSGDGAIQLEGP
jgi:glycosyltransferase involved in cell wall biosynthesis